MSSDATVFNEALKARLARSLREAMLKIGCDADEAAHLFGTSRGRVGALLNGHSSMFSMDFLTTCLFRCGYRTTFEVESTKDVSKNQMRYLK